MSDTTQAPNAPEVSENRPPRDEKEMLHLDEWKKLFEEGAQDPANREGKIVRGTVSAFTEEFALVSLGEGPVGQVALAELRRPDGSLSVAVGEELSVLVERVESARVVLSKEKAERAQRWEQAWQGLAEGATVEGVIAARVKGGLSVDVNGLRAFLPGSQVDVRPVRDLDPLVGQRFAFEIIKLDKKRGDLVLSRRSQAEQQRNEQKRQARTDLQEGAVVDGTVKSLTDFGAFIDLGGVDGLLAIPNMSWGRVKSPADLYKVGDSIQVKILKIDPANGKIALGTKQLHPDPWAGAVDSFPVGTKAKGRVVNLADYGAFVELAPGVDGLVHVSEMAWDRRIQHPKEVVQVGAEIEVVVLKIEREKKKIALGMKQLSGNPWVAFAEKHPVGTRLSGTVKNLADFGAFVNVAENIDGLLHASDISWTVRLRDVGEVIKKGDVLEVVVVRIDPEKERLSLGLKQKTSDPWPTLPDVFPMGRQVSATVKQVLSGGYLLELEGGVEGFISKSQFLPSKKDAKRKGKGAEGEAVEAAPKLPNVGDVLALQVRECDGEARRFGLSVRVDIVDEGRGDFAAYLAQQGKEKGSGATLGSLQKEKLGETLTVAAQHSEKASEN